MKLAALILLSTLCFAEDIPDWVMSSILRVETQSYYHNGTIKYVDKRRGMHGERGPFQCTKAAFNTVRHSGEQFWMVETDTKFADTIARRYLRWLRSNYGREDWYRTLGMYNAGPNRTSKEYIRKIQNARNNSKP